MVELFNGISGKAHAEEFFQSISVLDETIALLSEDLDETDRLKLEETAKFIGIHIETQARLSLGELMIS